MLYKETVEPDTLGLLKNLMNIPQLNQFRLVGGTALSLLFGHRKSVDLDLFTDQQFNREEILNTLASSFKDFTFADEKSSRLLFATINGVKVDFVNTFEDFVAGEVVRDDIRFAATEDIAALKLNAICGRGAKKDFWDLHALLKVYSFEELFHFYQEHYPNNSLMMVVKSIPYFVEAESDLDPFSFDGTTWNNIKQGILKKFDSYINK